jgi:hypothetical protein
MLAIMAILAAPVVLAVTSVRYGRDSRNLPVERNRPTI